MDGIVDILSKIGEISVTVGTAVKALIAFLSGVIASRKLPPKSDG